MTANISRIVRHPFGWTFILNGRYSEGVYRTSAIARQRLAHHKADRTPFYFA